MALVDGSTLAGALDLTYPEGGGDFDPVAAAADAIVSGLLTDEDHDDHPACTEAALAVALEMYQARTATGGQPVSIDFQPSPYRLSVWLTRRVAALTAAHADVRGWVG
jgi:hypothetical protein